MHTQAHVRIQKLSALTCPTPQAPHDIPCQSTTDLSSECLTTPAVLVYSFTITIRVNNHHGVFTHGDDIDRHEHRLSRVSQNASNASQCCLRNDASRFIASIIISSSSCSSLFFLKGFCALVYLRMGVGSCFDFSLYLYPPQLVLRAAWALCFYVKVSLAHE